MQENLASLFDFRIFFPKRKEDTSSREYTKKTSFFLVIPLDFRIFAKMKKFIKILFFSLNVLVAIALLVSSMAVWIAPDQVVWVSLFSFLYLPLVVLNILFALIWLLFKKKHFLLSTIVVGLRCMLIPLFVQVSGNTEGDGFKVMTFNVHHFFGIDDNRDQMDSNAMEFLRLVRDEDPLIICTQETGRVPSFCLADSLIAQGYKYIYSLHSSANDEPYGTTIFSKEKLDYVHSLDDGRKLYADLKVEGRTVRVMALHLASYTLKADEAEELHQPLDTAVAHKVIGKVIRTLKRHEQEWKESIKPVVRETPYPLIVLGDFNDTPASYVYHRMKKQGLKDSFVEQGKGIGATYNGPYPAYRIDYVLHSGELQCTAYKRINSELSDHSAVVATLKWKDPVQ